MRIKGIVPIFVLAACVACTLADAKNDVKDEEEFGVLDCVFEGNAGSCVRKRLARALDEMEVEVAGKMGNPPMSSVIEQAGNLVAELVTGVDADVDEDVKDKEDASETSRGMEEARRKKLGKKKKKHLQKLLAMAMLLKAKLSLILQLISTHLQVKFFFIAVISFMLNAVKFWLDLKKTHQPSKVIYYEHAQHQHRYDHDDEYGGYWRRSSNMGPDDIAYNAYVPDSTRN